MAFAYADSPDPIRADLVQQYRDFWGRLAAPGTWLTGQERVAVADESRRARTCALCAERKAALSPSMVDGEHDASGPLSATLVEVVHRITTDASRLSQSWVDGVQEAGLSAEAYVEAAGLTVQVISVDAFHDALGLALEPLPTPAPGEPTRKRPSAAIHEEGFVPMVPIGGLEPEDADIYGMPGGRAPNVIRALSLVPAEVRSWQALGGAQYLSPERMMGMETGRALDRAQIELVAGRVSALNECFY